MRPIPAIPQRVEPFDARVPGDLEIVAAEDAPAAEGRRDGAGSTVGAFPGERDGLRRAAHVAGPGTGARSLATREAQDGRAPRCADESFVHAAILARRGAAKCRTN